MKRDRKVGWGEIPRFTPGDVGKNYDFSSRTSRGPIDALNLNTVFSSLKIC